MNKLYNGLQTLALLGAGTYLLISGHIIAGGFLFALLIFTMVRYDGKDV